MPAIRYANHQEAWSAFPAQIRQLAQEPSVTCLCEAGGGANPLLSLDFIARHQLQYTVLDVSPDELAKAPAGYHQLVADVAAHLPRLDAQFELIFSRMLAEHVTSAEQFHRNVYALLRPGGRAVHLFPTLFSFPFLVNRLLPDRLSEPLLHIVQPSRVRSGNHGKFPAFYRWCRGPTERQLRRFERIGYVVEEYVGYFGHGYYDRLPAARFVQDRLARFLERRPICWLTTFAQVTLRKPEA